MTRGGVMKERKQVNLRLSDEDEAMLEALMLKIKEKTGIPVRTIDVFRIALKDLLAKYAQEPAEQEPVEPKKTRSKR